MGASENKVRLKRGEMFESVFKMAFNPDRPHSMQQSIRLWIPDEAPALAVVTQSRVATQSLADFCGLQVQ